MKIETRKAEFAPIIITLENRAEAAVLKAMASAGEYALKEINQAFRDKITSQIFGAIDRLGISIAEAK